MESLDDAFPWVPDRLARVFDHIDNELASPMDLASLARLACYSPHHFERVFGSYTDASPIDYLRRRRMQHAASRLRHEALPVGELGLDSGYSGYHAFAKAFLRTFGMTAGEWRHEAGWRAHMQHTIGRNGMAMPAALDFHRHGIVTREPEGVALQVAAQTEVVELPAIAVISRRVIGAWKDSAMTIAMANFMRDVPPLWSGGAVPRYIGLFHGDPGLAQRNDIVFEACMTPPDRVIPGHRKLVPGGFYARFRYDSGHPLFQRLYENWLDTQQLWQFDSLRPHLRCYPAAGEMGWIAMPVKPTPMTRR
ncbi:helix-turn-helix domain-containing protein [Chitinolyticbacter albus]|uniref:helix-turn-helix domain-containing protein n=1 Tax=Chitinolyticbacter albus TaxID=2961951 RepID=UPI00210B0143|nr:helix-turn-helix domain-containing protein [Chitinolyticbacter albus]